MNQAKKWLVTMGGVGYLPASGTFASLLTCLILWPIFLAIGPSIIWRSAIAAGGLLLVSILNVLLGKWAVGFFGEEDPGKFVLDEAAGICLTVIGLPTNHPVWMILLAAFLAFRVFDITKPPPARQLESLPHGWGILLDDLAAAVYANLVCQIVLRMI
ncbi:MAG: phosphatidylglycerophosphatase A [Tepidisphaeraceae bacterium]|jgi:phosphatidylglycerophosphatase A